jgi:hypothetical protein
MSGPVEGPLIPLSILFSQAAGFPNRSDQAWNFINPCK